METCHILFLDKNHEPVLIKKIKYPDRRNLRQQISNRLIRDRRFRKQIDNYPNFLIVTNAGLHSNFTDGVKKKS
jgi:hypothetical protein